MGGWRRKQVGTAVLAVVFVVLLSIYLYSSGEPDAPSNPTTTVAPQPVRPGR